LWCRFTCCRFGHAFVFHPVYSHKNTLYSGYTAYLPSLCVGILHYHSFTSFSITDTFIKVVTQVPKIRFCEYGNETWVPLKGRFLEYLSNF
jgi:hypothetical protein